MSVAEIEARPESWFAPYRPLTLLLGDPAVRDAARAARGHEAVCVSHQLPIWVTRRAVQGRQLWHDPRRRQCALGSVTSLEFTGDQAAFAGYHEPSGSAGSRVAGA